MATKNETKVQKALAQLDRQVDETELLPEPFETDEAQQIMYTFRSSPAAIIFEGENTEACRQQCLADFRDLNYLPTATRELVAFSKRSRQAVRRWLLGQTIPQGSDWLSFQYWLRAKGYKTKELDGMPSSFFRLRKHILMGDITFKEATRQLGFERQSDLHALLNNEVQERLSLMSAIARVHSLVAAIDMAITDKEMAGYLEVVLDPDGEFAEVKRLYSQRSRVRPDEARKLIPRR